MGVVSVLVGSKLNLPRWYSNLGGLVLDPWRTKLHLLVCCYCINFYFWECITFIILSLVVNYRFYYLCWTSKLLERKQCLLSDFGQHRRVHIRRILIHDWILHSFFSPTHAQAVDQFSISRYLPNVHHSIYQKTVFCYISLTDTDVAFVPPFTERQHVAEFAELHE